MPISWNEIRHNAIKFSSKDKPRILDLFQLMAAWQPPPDAMRN
jgi:hypothetical protein